MGTSRTSWQDLPPALCERVERHFRAPIEGFETKDGGFSVGAVVGVATSSEGRRVFVKAVPERHPAAADYRSEAAVSRALPADVPSPRLRLFVEVAGWVLLAFDVVEGRVAFEPWIDPDLEAVLASLDVASRSLSSVPAGLALPTVSDRMSGRCDTWRMIEATGRHGPLRVEQLGAWERSNLTRLAVVERDWEAGLPGTSLLHFDLRHDNCLISVSGNASFVDWGRACVGPAWVDLVCLLLESDLGARDPEKLLLTSPSGQAANPADVDRFLVALASYWNHAAALPAVNGAPHLRARQRYSASATNRWLRQRWADG